MVLSKRMNRLIGLLVGVWICTCGGCANKVKDEKNRMDTCKIQPDTVVYRPSIQLSILYSPDKISVSALNKGDVFIGNLRLDLFDLKGNRLESTILAIELPAQASTLLFKQSTKDCLNGHQKKDVVLNVLLTKHNEVIAQDSCCFKP